jgi:hypothetical protein
MNVDGLRIIFVLAFSQPKVDRFGEAGWLAAVDKPVFEPSLIGFPDLNVGKRCFHRGTCLMDMIVGHKQLEGKKASWNGMGKRKCILCPY